MKTITGNTYPVKTQLRALGGTWSRRAQGWIVPDDRADEARALVQGAPRSSGSSYTRFAGGAEQYTNRRGRCEDAPCCGCCT